MIALKYITDSKLSNVAVEVKLVWFVCLSVIILFVNSTSTQAILFLALLSLAFIGGIKLPYILSILKIFWPIFLVVFVLHLFYHDGRILFQLWMFKATDSGIRAGIFNLVRFMNFIIIAICLLSWTSPQEIAGKVFGGFGGEVAALINEQAFEHLDGPVKRVGSTFTPVGFNRILESAILPNIARIEEAVIELLNY